MKFVIEFYRHGLTVGTESRVGKLDDSKKKMFFFQNVFVSSKYYIIAFVFATGNSFLF